MRSFGASRWQTFRLVEAPAALPGLITGAKLSLAFAGIAAILAEWAGSENGLGHLVLQALPQFETARAYAGVFILAAFSVALFGALSLAERRLVPWAQSRPTMTPSERNHPVTIRRALPAVLAALLALGLAACGEREEPAGTGASPSASTSCSTTSRTPTTRASTTRSAAGSSSRHGSRSSRGPRRTRRRC